MLAFEMVVDYPDSRTSRLPAWDRRSRPRALCMLQPSLTAVAWESTSLTLAGLGEHVDAPTLPRSRRTVQHPTCLSGQTATIVEWLLACRRTRGRTHLRLDLLGIAGRLPRLDPDLDIPLTEQRQLLQLWSRGDHCTHFQRLGMMPTTDPGEIRRAYLATCQRFHPDRWYGRRIGTFAGVLLDLIHRAHAAQVFLADPQRCAGYLRELAAAGHRIELADAITTPCAPHVVARAPWTRPRLYIVPSPPRPPSR
jgi:hypothetical protein